MYVRLTPHTFMIHRNSLKCSTCNTSATTRTAIGHGGYQEFAFPCPGCGVEIRFGMTLDQEAITFEYDKLMNATWSDEDDGAAEFTFDSEHLCPKTRTMISPFVQTLFLPRDPEEFMKAQRIRFTAATEIWPRLERLRTHFLREQWSYFEVELKALGYEIPAAEARERRIALSKATQQYGRFFGRSDSNAIQLVLERLKLAISNSASGDVATYLISRNRHLSIEKELLHIRQEWVKVFPILFPIYLCLHWDNASHSLDDYTLAQKRFVELKPFYVDCFETLARISVIAAAIEGSISLSRAVIPTKKGHITISAFELMANGSKPDVLKNLPIADLFVPFMDSQLRNGLGHNAARYDVKTDSIEYTNEGKAGSSSFTIGYSQFCEKLVLLYGQVEAMAMYVDWLGIMATPS